MEDVQHPLLVVSPGNILFNYELIYCLDINDLFDLVVGFSYRYKCSCLPRYKV